MTQCKEGFGNIAGHGDVNMAGRIIPVDRETEVAGPGPVFRKRILGGESVKEVIGVRLREEFDAKVVDGKGECGASIGVAPEARRLGDWMITVRGEMRLQLIVGEDGGLFEAVHALADLDINVTFGIEVFVGKVVLINNLLWEVAAVDPHVLKNEHVGAEEEVLEVAGTVASTEMRIRDDTIEVELGIHNADSGRADVLIGVKAIATHRHADAEDFSLAGTHGADKVCIGHFATSGDLMGKNENHGVVSKDAIGDGAGLSDPLGASAPLVGQ